MNNSKFNIKNSKLFPHSEFSRNVLTLMTGTTLYIRAKIKKQYIGLIKFLYLFLYNLSNNVHHCIYLKMQSMGFFYLENK